MCVICSYVLGSVSSYTIILLHKMAYLQIPSSWSLQGSAGPRGEDERSLLVPVWDDGAHSLLCFSPLALGSGPSLLWLQSHSEVHVGRMGAYCKSLSISFNGL